MSCFSIDYTRHCLLILSPSGGGRGREGVPDRRYVLDIMGNCRRNYLQVNVEWRQGVGNEVGPREVEFVVVVVVVVVVGNGEKCRPYIF